MNIKKDLLGNLSKNELIDSALLNAVSGGGCERWVETCGCKSGLCDWCGKWVPRSIIIKAPFDEL